MRRIRPRKILSPSEIAIDRIVPNPKQPRRTFMRKPSLKSWPSRFAHKGRASSPSWCRPDPSQRRKCIEIIAGERRWRAVTSGGPHGSIPAVVREMDDREMLEIAIIENVQRV